MEYSQNKGYQILNILQLLVSVAALPATLYDKQTGINVQWQNTNGRTQKQILNSKK